MYILVNLRGKDWLLLEMKTRKRLPFLSPGVKTPAYPCQTKRLVRAALL